MYRGSTFLLSADYKIHISIVKELMKEEYDDLWNITYDNLDDEKDNIVNLIHKIKNEYGCRPKDVKNIYEKKQVGSVTDTLATKILLGTLACIPAYDTYFTNAIRKYKRGVTTPNDKSIEALSRFYGDNKDELNDLLVEFEDDVKYPQMKLLDMGFFEYGRKLQDMENKKKKNGESK